LGAILIHNLTKCYGRRVGVRELSLEIPEGVVFGFLGPNGAGKTTAIRVLMGFLRPTEGSATVLGRDSWRRSHEVKKNVGYLPGDLRLYSWWTARRAFDLVSRIRRIDLRRAGLEYAARFELDTEVRVSRMSRGTRQKLGLVLALMHRPPLLILDEPTSGLDPLMQDRLKEYVHDCAREGRTVFFSSHSLSEVENVCDRVAIMRQGRMVADETLTDLRARARRLVTIRWRRDAQPGDLQPPSFLTVEERGDSIWRCTLGGSSATLIEWLADKPVADLSIGEPDLESLFRRYYRAGEGSRTAEASEDAEAADAAEGAS
jgi:ABC-2 type transport system ATP-binding protein